MHDARLYEESRLRAAWLQAASEITRMLLSGADETEVFTAIAEHVRDLSEATDAGVLLPGPNGRLQVAAGVGPIAASAVGMEVQSDRNVAAKVFDDGVAMNLTAEQVADAQRGRPGPAIGPALIVPLSAAGHTRGVLIAVREPDGEPFPQRALEAVHGFAEQAELACELAERRRDSEALALFAERDRIARNLHDLVIQRLFATGMALEGAAALVDSDPRDAARRIRRAVDDLDTTIKEIRTTVFALQQPVDATGSLRAEIIDVVEAAVTVLGFSPSVRFDGLVDTAVGERVTEHLLAVLREALSNVARHARARSAQVSVSARERLVLQVNDDGVGIAPTGRRSGLANMAARAEELGGELTITDGDPGTVLRWSVPLRPETG